MEGLEVFEIVSVFLLKYEAALFQQNHDNWHQLLLTSASQQRHCFRIDMRSEAE